MPDMFPGNVPPRSGPNVVPTITATSVEQAPVFVTMLLVCG